MKFPKETRNAVMFMLSNKNEVRSSSSQFRNSISPNRNAFIKNSETQTSPVISTTRVYPAFKIPKNFKKIPCPKNLLCEKGLHAGKCGRIITQKAKITLSKRGRRFINLARIPILN